MKIRTYRIREKLAEGVQGETFLAEDEESNRTVVLKRLPILGAGEWKIVELFERESKLLERLDHPDIPDYIDAFEEEGTFYLIQEYVEGKDLRAHLESGAVFSDEQVYDFVRSMLEILRYLHSRTPPVVHRDIKPSNIVVRLDGSYALVDFSAIQDVIPKDTGGSTIIGTSGYMPIEQLMGQSVPASDLYGLGATTIHLITHRDPSELPVEHLRLQYRQFADISDSFASFLDKLIAPDAGDRFQNAGEALEVLERVRRGEHFGPKPVAPAVHRRRAVLIAAGLVAALVVGGAVGLGFYFKGNTLSKKRGPSNDQVSAKLKLCIEQQLPQHALKLKCNFKKITDLRLLDSIPNASKVVEISLGKNRINDLAPLRRFTGLVKLWLFSNRIRDLKPLAGLQKLEFLQLGRNSIADLTPLKNLKRLNNVILSNNVIEDISPLAGLKNLRSVSLDGNRIADLRPLSRFKSTWRLSSLDLGNNPIGDLRPIRWAGGFVNLKHLGLSKCGLIDISPLVELSTLDKLTYLNLSQNKIRDIGPLKHLRHLNRLYLYKNRIADVSPLLNFLSRSPYPELSISYNCIQDFSPIRGWLHRTRVYWKPQKKCPGLRPGPPRESALEIGPGTGARPRSCPHPGSCYEIRPCSGKKNCMELKPAPR